MGGCCGPDPVTLFINHESRQETLKHYMRFSGVGGSQRDLTMCLNPRIDSAHVILDRLLWPYDAGLKEFSMRFPGLLGSIKMLEINDDNCFMQTEIANLSDYVEDEFALLSLFTGLEEVGFWPQGFYHDHGDPEWRYVSERRYTSWNDVAESVVAELQALLKKQKKENPTCAEPKVELRRKVLDKCPEAGCCY